jgi:hypothetical protein
VTVPAAPRKVSFAIGGALYFSSAIRANWSVSFN